MKRDVGVVTPTHPGRASHLLEAAIRSVYVQTVPVHAHAVYVDHERYGAAYARQRALDMNHQTWTAFLDSDDWFMPEHIEVLLRGAEESGADYVYSWFFLGNGQGYITDHDSVFPITHYTEPWDPTKPRHTTMTVLVKTELAKEVGFITVPDNGEIAHRQGEDWEFTLGCNNLGTIHHIVQRTWVWNHHGANTSGIPGRGDAQ